MPMHPDTVYSPSPTAQPATVSVYSKAAPWQSNEERLVSEALAASQTPGAALQQLVRPPLPRTQLFPPKYGYRQEAIGIRDIIDVDVLFPGARVDYSQSQSGYSGTSYPSLNQF